MIRLCGCIRMNYTAFVFINQYILVMFTNLGWWFTNYWVWKLRSYLVASFVRVKHLWQFWCIARSWYIYGLRWALLYSVMKVIYRIKLFDFNRNYCISFLNSKNDYIETWFFSCFSFHLLLIICYMSKLKIIYEYLRKKQFKSN